MMSLIGCNKNTQSEHVADVPQENVEEAKQSYQKGIHFHEEGDLDEALKAYDKAIQLDTDYAEAYYEKGRVLYMMQDYDKAIQTLDVAIKLNPNYADAYFYKGIIYRELKQYDKALQALNRVIEMDEKNTLAYINKARSLQGLKKYHEVIQTLDSAIEQVPDDDSLHYEKAIVYSLMGNFDDAIKSLTKSIELNPNNAKIARNDDALSGLNDLEDYQVLLGIDDNESSDNTLDNSDTIDEKPLWKFNLEDLYVNEQPILYVSYEEIIDHFSEPMKIDSYQVRMPGTEDYNYFLRVKYEGLDLEFIFYDEILEKPNPGDTVKRFDLTGQNIELASGLKVGMTVDEVIHEFGAREVYDLNNTKTTEYEASAINHILTAFKPENYYSQYTQAMYIDMDYEKIQPNEVFAYMGLVLLIKDNKVDRIVVGYPNLS